MQLSSLIPINVDGSEIDVNRFKTTIHRISYEIAASLLLVYSPRR